MKRQIDLNLKKLLRSDAKVCEDTMEAASLFFYSQEMTVYHLTEDLTDMIPANQRKQRGCLHFNLRVEIKQQDLTLF